MENERKKKKQGTVGMWTRYFKLGVMNHLMIKADDNIYRIFSLQKNRAKKQESRKLLQIMILK